MSGLLVNLFIFFFYNITKFFLPIYFKSKMSLSNFAYFCFCVVFLPLYSKDCCQKSSFYLTVWATAIQPFRSLWNSDSEFSTQKSSKVYSTSYTSPLSFPSGSHFSVPRHFLLLSWFCSFLIILSLCKISCCLPCLEISPALSSKTADYLSNHC